MTIFEKIVELRDFINNLKHQGKTIGFVPTMGALHEGHISLVEKSVLENDFTIVSIFVNPIQFNNAKDLEKYPRTLEKDYSLLKEAGTDAVFVPTVKEMYPEPLNRNYEFGQLANVMEGEFRPGHFNGVAIVVHRLFEIVTPNRAYFGEKDYQQLMIIKALVKNLHLPVEIIPCPISREKDGLARSSRNERLTKEMRKAAPFIYQQLSKAKDLAHSLNSQALEEKVAAEFRSHELLELEYFKVADGDTLQIIEGAIPANAYGFIAVYAGDVRLIDNIRLI